MVRLAGALCMSNQPAIDEAALKNFGRFELEEMAWSKFHKKRFGDAEAASPDAPRSILLAITP